MDTKGRLRVIKSALARNGRERIGCRNAGHGGYDSDVLIDASLLLSSPKSLSTGNHAGPRIATNVGEEEEGVGKVFGRVSWDATLRLSLDPIRNGHSHSPTHAT